MLEDLIKKVRVYTEFKEQTEKELFNQLTLFVYYLFSKQKNMPDLYILARLLDDENLKRLRNYYKSGEKLVIPSEDEWNEAEILACVFYLREVENMDWPDIQNIMKQKGIEINAYSMGSKVADIKKGLIEELFSSMSEIGLETVEGVIQNER